MAGKCGHSACKCAVTGAASGFCGDYCEAQGRQTQDERCECGHAVCDQTGSE